MYLELFMSAEYNFNLQALWQLLWVIPPSSTQKALPNHSDLKKLSVENVKTKARVGLSELLAQVSIYHSIIFFISFKPQVWQLRCFL
jgi:hypothetical protein